MCCCDVLRLTIVFDYLDISIKTCGMSNCKNSWIDDLFSDASVVPTRAVASAAGVSENDGRAHASALGVAKVGAAFAWTRDDVERLDEELDAAEREEEEECSASDDGEEEDSESDDEEPEPDDDE